VTRAVLTIACLFLLGTSMALADTLWTRRYSGPAGDDVAKVVLTDASNNVIMVGSSAGYDYANDFVVVKYSPDGDTFWTRRIAGPPGSNDDAMAAAIDPSGAVSITGSTGSWPDFNILTVKLYPDGSQFWRATYTGSGNSEDGGTAIAVDDSGDVFVTGSTMNATNTDFVTIKYNVRGGEPVWTAILNNGGDDHPTAIALGPDGSVYVTGYSMRGGYADYATVKYSAAGVEEWVSFYNGPGNAPDQALALAVDASGNAYVTGASATAPPPGGTNHYATVKYNSAGVQQWAVRYERAGSEAAALALGAPALYVTGKTTGAGGNSDYCTIAYDFDTGDTLWARLYDGPTGGGDVAVDIAVGPDGGVWVTGSSQNDYATVLYSPGGVQEWVETYNSSYDGDDKAAAITIDTENKVIVTGTSWADGNYDIVTVKFDTLPPGIAESPGSEPSSDFRFSVAPNPNASGFANLRFGPASAGAASITVLGVDGRVLLTRSIQTYGAYGTNGTYPLDLRKLGAGVYVVRLQSGGRSATQKLVVGQ